ncbi:hypothetical protein PIB30_098386 [Stylosanthes scabra]|uniref:Uncharacterized protein n=1 Tax=Stylosanthes scabra TaxID=79078 RepID=A0ABU6RWG2_9FABA|nr:hypothetical protein [Stylosanthes scabra]
MKFKIIRNLFIPISNKIKYRGLICPSTSSLIFSFLSLRSLHHQYCNNNININDTILITCTTNFIFMLQEFIDIIFYHSPLPSIAFFIAKLICPSLELILASTLVLIFLQLCYYKTKNM